MSRRADMLERLRARHPRRLDAVYRVERVAAEETPAASGSAAGDSALWIGAARQIRVLDAAAPARAPGLLVSPRPASSALPTLFALAAILSSRYMTAMLWPESDARGTHPEWCATGVPTPSAKTLSAEALQALPLPEIPADFDAQLTALWQYGANLKGPNSQKIRASLRGSFDRITAEIYALSLNELMSFESVPQNYHKAES